MNKTMNRAIIGFAAVTVTLAICINIFQSLNKKPEEKLQSRQFICDNKCQTKMMADIGKGHETRDECFANCQVTDGWMERGGECLDMSLMNAGSPSSTTSCLLTDDNCFMTEYGCWQYATNGGHNWLCGGKDGCMRTNCSTDADDCFSTEKECDKKCKAECTALSGCVNTVKCAHPSNCFGTYKDCDDRCKKLTCDKVPGVKDPDAPKACLISLCDPDDKACLNSNAESNIKKCTKDCGWYGCHPYDGGCRAPRQGESCIPGKDCWQGVAKCEKESKCKKTPSICNNTLGMCFPAPSGKCKKNDPSCYNSMGECTAECSSKGYDCAGGCNKPMDCPMWPGVQGMKCWTDKKACKTNCKKDKKDGMYVYYQGECVKSPTGVCDATQATCYMDESFCKYSNGLL